MFRQRTILWSAFLSEYIVLKFSEYVLRTRLERGTASHCQSSFALQSNELDRNCYGIDSSTKKLCYLIPIFSFVLHIIYYILYIIIYIYIYIIYIILYYIILYYIILYYIILYYIILYYILHIIYYVLFYIFCIPYSIAYILYSIRYLCV